MDRTLLLGLTILALASSFSQAGSLEFSLATYSVAENASSFVVTVERSGNLSAPASVTVKSFDGSAIVADDYQNMSQVLTWNAAESGSKTVTINILDDRLVEGDESFRLDLINPVGDTVGTRDSTTVTISDYEEGDVQFSSATYQVEETAIWVELLVHRLSGANGVVTVDYATANNVAQQGTDYLQKSGTLTFEDGETTRRVTIGLVNDELGEIDESFFVTLSAVTGGALLGTIESTDVTIVDDDEDFTPALNTLLLEIQQTTQVEAVDLSQASFSDTARSLLDTINEIPVLSTTDLVAKQSSNGQVSIVVGDDVFLFRPLTVTRADPGTEIGIFLQPDNSGIFRTVDGVDILFQPSVLSINVLQAALEALELPELSINSYGNITIQADQGPPPLEMDENGKLVINNSFYDRYNLRPVSFARPSSAAISGIEFKLHPTFPQESVLVITAQLEGSMRSQLLTPAPIDALQLRTALSLEPGFSGVEIDDYSILSFTLNGDDYLLFPDYIIRLVENFSAEDVGVSFPGDLNQDGYGDLKMVFDNGDEQFFYLIPAQ